jgi:hypothetical protein
MKNISPLPHHGMEFLQITPPPSPNLASSIESEIDRSDLISAPQCHAHQICSIFFVILYFSSDLSQRTRTL